MWSVAVAPEGGTRVLPDGCMDLLSRNGELVVAGPDTRAHVFDATSNDPVVGLRFPPGTGPAVFGVAADELRDQRVPVTALWGEALGRRLTERLAAAPDTGR
ncbi:DUF6597 domain-containing transcriptional factor, partial [Saccharomonospora saliphila]|uniref:DUF6597 domain-containing transcriptional factor n=1 Tax=Saccharomonospora saliphila TaxID=369829 RepID=UPI00037CAD3E